MEKLVLLAALVGAILAMAQFPDGLHRAPAGNSEDLRRQGRSFG